MKSARAYLQLLEKKDFPEILNMFQEPGMFQYIGPLANKPSAFYLDFMETRMFWIREKMGYYWVARSRETDELIGCVNLTPWRDSERMQVGMQLRRKFWGKGFATELTPLAVTYAFESWGLDAVYAFYETEHHASRQVLSKLGFRFVEHIEMKNENVSIEVVIKEKLSL